MEGNQSAGNVRLEAPYMHRPHHQQYPPRINVNLHANLSGNPVSAAHPQMPDGLHDPEHVPLTMDCRRVELSKIHVNEEDELSSNGIDSRNETREGKYASLGQRMRWTDEMVKLLITALSYMGDDAAANGSADVKRKAANLHKIGKWRLVSEAMNERGFHVSPQQCEDKFNDVNKRYKKLTEILGKGTSCDVVKNPAMLDLIDHLSDMLKDKVRKILNSRQLFYEEMCSYRNGNRLHLPADPALQQSLQHFRLKDRVENGARTARDAVGEVDRGIYADDKEDDTKEKSTSHGSTRVLHVLKRKVQRLGYHDMSLGNGLNSLDSSRRLQPKGISVGVNQVFSERSMEEQRLRSRSLQLAEQRQKIHEEMLELEKERFSWQRLSKLEDEETDRMRRENEWIKFENGQLALELKWKELELKNNLNRSRLTSSEECKAHL